MVTKKKKSGKRQISWYDFKSLCIQLLIVLGPYILANINDIQILLEEYTGDPATTAILITTLGLFIKKLITNYEKH